MTPAALTKAESLHRFAVDQGAPLLDFQLTLSTDEGLELLDWFLAQYEQNMLLAEDVAQAKRLRDPFPVLEHFTLMGFSLAPLETLH